MSCFWTFLIVRTLIKQSTPEQILFYDAKYLTRENKNENKNSSNDKSEINNKNENSKSEKTNLNKTSFKKLKKIHPIKNSITNLSFDFKKNKKLSSKIIFGSEDTRVELDPDSGAAAAYEKIKKNEGEKKYSNTICVYKQSDDSLDLCSYCSEANKDVNLDLEEADSHSVFSVFNEIKLEARQNTDPRTNCNYLIIIYYLKVTFFRIFIFSMFLIY